MIAMDNSINKIGKKNLLRLNFWIFTNTLLAQF